MIQKATRKVAVSALLAAMVMLLSTSVVGAIGNIQNLDAHGGGATGALAIAQTLVGDGVTVTSATFTGNAVQIGTFNGATDQIGFEEGIILSSGSISNIGQNYIVGLDTNLSGAGDADLTALAQSTGDSNSTSRDAAVLTLTFTPAGDRAFFRYVFASEEYEVYIGTQFNDVFAFYVNGENCALVGDDPITINTINPYTNAELYRRNTGGQIPGIAFNGLTRILTCEAAVNPNVENTLKLAISDAADYILDSAVFIKAASFTTTPEVVVDDVTGTEGSVIPLVGTVTDPDSTDLTYSWAIDDISPVGANCSLGSLDTLATTITCDDQASVTVSLAVDDGISPVSSDTGTVTVRNVNPTVSNVMVQSLGSSLLLTASTSDPSSADAGAGFTYQWSVNNGPFVNGSNPAFFQVNHAQTGQTIRVIAVDKDGGQSTPYVVPVVSAMDLLNALRADIQTSRAPADAKSRLLSQLNNVQVMLMLQQNGLAAVQLDIFIGRVGMFSKAGVPRNDATDFVQQAEAIKDVLGY